MGKHLRGTSGCRKSWRELHIGVQKSLKTELKKLARGQIQGKPLGGRLLGLWRLDIGNHRAIYKDDGETIMVVDVGHRSVIYGKARSDVNEDSEPI